MFKHLTLTNVFDYLTNVVAIATGIRLALHWGRGLFALWISEDSSFWKSYEKVELTIAYIAFSLAAYGRKKAVSTFQEPITKGSPGEGQIKP